MQIYTTLGKHSLHCLSFDQIGFPIGIILPNIAEASAEFALLNTSLASPDIRFYQAAEWPVPTSVQPEAVGGAESARAAQSPISAVFAWCLWCYFEAETTPHM